MSQFSDSYMFKIMLTFANVRLYFKLKSESVTHSVVSDSLRPRGPRLLCPCNSPGKNTAVDSHSLLQGIFPTQGLCFGEENCYMNINNEMMVVYPTDTCETFLWYCFSFICSPAGCPGRDALPGYSNRTRY